MKVNNDISALYSVFSTAESSKAKSTMYDYVCDNILLPIVLRRVTLAEKYMKSQENTQDLINQEDFQKLLNAGHINMVYHITQLQYMEWNKCLVSSDIGVTLCDTVAMEYPSDVVCERKDLCMSRCILLREYNIIATKRMIEIKSVLVNVITNWSRNISLDISDYPDIKSIFDTDNELNNLWNLMDNVRNYIPEISFIHR